jgi:hypothetical protein
MRILSFSDLCALRLLRRGLIWSAIVLLMMSIQIAVPVSAQQPAEYWIDWNRKLGPQSFSMGYPYGKLFMTGHNFIVPAGQYHVGYIVDVIR